MISTVILGAFGKKAKFIITPKDAKYITFLEMLKTSYVSVIFGLIIAVTTYFAYKSLIPTLILSLCCILCPIVVLMANIPTRQYKNKKVTSTASDAVLCNGEGAQFNGENADRF